ncbi:sigma-54-dependent Fis family transcriptional regulator [Iodidimonas gelatinilytica]|uniref:DNA-binding transcriptional regulator NtrC n=1 Tax=Iodidimonas gelatinilytica TaxID=1236966 RepID=A0A5A7MUM0_9PROT|nr:sigma-54 dependent transcriptional regulator [Iodidimonas gelatinilytica]GEQ97375.1 sigma-54-dependent Fis family transcriptional regulator [Iodidimonas gelatinilytica]GEQ99700.1 sigma-54-dependent Fis family transcriptional regulator [Iodidimonas gelatinilytica]
MIHAPHLILVVDDEPTQRHLLSGMITRAGHRVETASDGQAALTRLLDQDLPAVSCLVLDLQMPGLSGLELLEKLKPHKPNLPVIVLTAHSGVTRIVQAMKAGASDFLVKPASAERIRTAIDSALSHVAMTGELAPMRATEQAHPGFDDLIGESDTLKSVVRLAKKAAKTSIPVLIEGASGVGKEMFARAIHESSDRAGKPFVAVNCGAIPENLVESILFGHEKGAFTGAVERHIGKFQDASGGTLFLDEVGELPHDIQVKLLRVLQENEVDPIGGGQTVPVDIRLISATNRNMADLVSKGIVREDLFYRLNVFPLTIPSLKDRADDIPQLAQHFARIIALTEGIEPKTLSKSATIMLRRYPWPGNIRQLQNAVFRAVVMSDGPKLEVEDFPQIAPKHTAPPSGLVETSGSHEDSTPCLPLITEDGDFRTLADIEAEAIEAAIQRYDGRLSEVARRLGIGRSTLYRRLDELGLSPKTKQARV